jgi:hypothetical protein
MSAGHAVWCGTVCCKVSLAERNGADLMSRRTLMGHVLLGS